MPELREAEHFAVLGMKCIVTFPVIESKFE